MWEPTATNNPSSSTSKDDKQHVDNSQIDSGFLSSEQILSSYPDDYPEEEQSRQQLGKAPQLDAIPSPFSGSTSSKGDKLATCDSECLDSGLVECKDEELAGEGDNEMLLERDVDHGMAEWACRSTKNSTAQKINNLSRKVDNATMSLQQLNITANNNSRPKTATREAAAAAAPQKPIEIPEEEQPWEMCYKQDVDGDTYLHLTVSEGAEEIVRDLIKITPHPCLLDIQNDLQQSALHLAVLVSNVRLVRMLLLAGAESSIRDKYGNTPLHLACAAGDLDCVRALTERITAMEEATAVSCTGVLISSNKSKGGDVEMTKLDRPHMVQYADVELRNYDGERCVHIAAAVTGTAQNKHVDVMRQLVVRSGADVNAREGKAGYTPLHMAVERGDKDLVKFLLDECSNLNLEVASYGRWTAFQIATVNRNKELLTMLRSKGAEPLDVSSSEESDDSDLDDNEIDFEMYGHSAGSGSNTSYHNGDRMVPCVGC